MGEIEEKVGKKVPLNAQRKIYNENVCNNLENFRSRETITEDSLYVKVKVKPPGITVKNCKFPNYFVYGSLFFSLICYCLIKVEA